ncbi:MAG TPA: spore germination protein GerW family protein [Bdellovibrionales bacterium]|nr:spore germination protein GerW family protein [Bdellovibrionales bacterium]
MDSVKDLLETTLKEVDRLLTAKTVVGEPIKVGNDTIVPLMSMGFGFGAGGGKGTDKSANSGEGGGSGAGAGIRPVAVIVIGPDGQVRVQPLKGGLGDALGKIATSIGDAINKGKGEAATSA